VLACMLLVVELPSSRSWFRLQGMPLGCVILTQIPKK